MKILLVCAAGMSTSVLMKKIKKWCQENGEELEIQAVGTTAYESEWTKYDCILVGPQIRYKVDDIRKDVSIPVEMIPGPDYAIGNAANIMKLAHKITGK